MYGEGSFGVMTFRDATGRNAALGALGAALLFPSGGRCGLADELSLETGQSLKQNQRLSMSVLSE